MAKVLTSAIGVPGADAVALVGPRATTSAVLGYLNMLQVRPPDHLVFAFSGHADDRGIGLADGVLRHGALRDAIARIPARTHLGIFDCCHAASFRRKTATFGGDAVGGPLEFTWIDALAAATPGGRAMFASAADRNAYEDHARGHGRFTAAFLDAMCVTPGDPDWLGLLANERAVFQSACVLMRERYGDDQGATGLRLVGDLPLVQSQHLGAVGSAAIDALVPRAWELAADLGYTVEGRRHLPTRMTIRVGRRGGPVLATRSRWLNPRYDEVTDIESVALEPGQLRPDRSLVMALARGHSVPIVWEVVLRDQLRRVLARAHATQTLAYSSGILYAA